MQIRSDFVGVVFVHVHGSSVMLRAGDEVPSGGSIDEALIESDSSAKPKTKAASRAKKTTKSGG